MRLIPLQGIGQMTPAQQNTVRQAAGGTARASTRKRSRGSKSRSVKRAVKRTVKRAAKRAAKSAGRKALKKGSAAAKKFMAALRAKRRKK